MLGSVHRYFAVPMGARDAAAISEWWWSRRSAYFTVTISLFILSACFSEWAYSLSPSYDASDDGPFGLLGALCGLVFVLPVVLHVVFQLGATIEKIVARRRPNRTHSLAAGLLRAGFAVSVCLPLSLILLALGMIIKHG